MHTPTDDTLLANRKTTQTGEIVAVAAAARHGFAKQELSAIELVAGLGVKGDAHSGATVRHLFDMRCDPSRPNRRQVHLIEAALLDELRDAGFAVAPGELGENMLVSGIELTTLPAGTRLHIGASAIVELTGLREPCIKMDRFAKGLRAVVTDRRDGARYTRRSVMGIVVESGTVRPRDAIAIEEPTAFIPLQLV